MPSSVVHGVVLALLSGFMYGYNTGIISGIDEPAVNGFFNATFARGGDGPDHAQCIKEPDHPSLESVDADAATMATWKGLFVSNILVGMTAGAIVGPMLANRIGRRKGLIVVSLNATVCPILLGWLLNFWAQVLVRTLLGVSVGMIACICPLYITETAPPNRRGQVATIFQLNICLSIFFALVVNYIYNNTNAHCLTTESWMTQLRLGAIPGALSLLYCTFVLPESEAWLTSQIVSSGEDLNSNMGVSQAPRVNENGGNSGYRLLCSRKGWKWLIICIGLPLCQQLTGINAIIFYGPIIFKSAAQPLVTNFLVVGLFNTCAVSISIFLIDRLGRRILMLSGLAAMIVAATMMGVNYLVTDGKGNATVSTISILLYLAGFESGPGPLFFLMASEAFPVDIRSEALTLSNLLCNLMNIFTSFTFPVLLVAFGSGFVFLFYATVSVIGFAFVYFMLPETKGTSAEDLRKLGNENEYVPLSISDLEGLKAGENFRNPPMMTPAGVSWTPTNQKKGELERGYGSIMTGPQEVTRHSSQ